MLHQRGRTWIKHYIKNFKETLQCHKHLNVYSQANKHLNIDKGAVVA